MSKKPSDTSATGDAPLSEAELDAQAEADARADLEAQDEAGDSDETAKQKAERRAQLIAEREAKLASRSAKEQDRARRAAERAKRAVLREERDKKNAVFRAERTAKLAESERAKNERQAKIAEIAAARAAREAAIEAARKRRALTPEEQAEMLAYAESAPPPRPSVWVFQVQVIRALVLRNMGARFGATSRLSYLWALLNPLLLMCGLLLVFTLRSRIAPANLPLLVFIFTGYPIWFGFFGMWGATAGADGDPSMLMFPQITVLDLIIARFVLEFATTTLVYLIMVAGAILIGRAEMPSDFMGLMFAFWACVWLGFAFGLTICSLKRFVPMIEEWLTPVRRAGIFVSGVIFTAASLPSWMLPYLSWNPLFRAIEVARECWHPSYQSPIADPMYVFLVAFALTAFAITAERLTRRYSTI
jgi:capsular polysaccharide transport system permease protein